MPKGKRRRINGDEEGEVEVGEEVGVIVATSIPRGPKGFVAGAPRGRGGNRVVVAGAPVGPRSGLSGRGVANPNFPMFFGSSRGFPGDHEKWPVRHGGGYR